MSLFDAVAHRDRADRPALRTSEVTYDYAALAGLVEETARALIASGVAKGDCVLLLLPNGVEHVVALLAAGRAGAIAIPCDPVAGSARMAAVVDETAPRLCLVHAEECSPGGAPAVRFRVDPMARSACFSPAPPPADAELPGPPAGGDPALIRFTSGSAGRPKGVVLAHDQLLWTARMLSERFGLAGDHRELVLSPLFHSGAWQRVAATLFGGGCVVLSTEPVSLPGVLEDIESFDVTGFFAVPPLIRMLLAAAPKARAALARCRSIEIGSAPLGGDELAGLLELAPTARIFVHYGLTECSRALILDACEQPAKLETVGRPTNGVELSIRDEEGGVLGPGEPGEIFLRGPQLARGYWKRPDLDAESFVEGWLATGDVGKLDDEGFLRILGRRDDKINSAGYSFFPAEVEAELGPVEGVSQYLIAGVPDPRGVLGEVPWAFVVPDAPRDFSPRGFAVRAREKLPAYMVPRKVVTVPALPMTATGKPDRRAAVKNWAPATGS